MRKIIITISMVVLLAISFVFFQASKNIEKVERNYTTTTTQPHTINIQQTEERVSYKEVHIYADKFEPNEISISENEKVRWVNKDKKEHEIVCVANGEPLFDIIINAGETFDFSFFSNAECWEPIVGENRMRMKITIR